MQLNPSKTQTAIIGSKHNQNKIKDYEQNIKKIRVKATEIEYAQSVKYLGFNFNSLFNSENQVNSIIKNVNFTLSKLRHCKNSVNTETKLQIIKAVVCPIFDYAAIIYHGHNIHGSGMDEMRLNVSMNSCIRYISNLYVSDHISNKYNELKILNAFNRREMLICCFIYNYIHTQTPAYLKDIFKINKNKTRSGTDTISLIVKQVKKNSRRAYFRT